MICSLTLGRNQKYRLFNQLKLICVLNELSAKRKITNDAVLNHRSQAFEQEQNRQRSQVKRFDKIDVIVKDPFVLQTSLSDGNSDQLCLKMNNNLSTPYECAMHVNSFLAERSVLAIVNDKLEVDMHRPLSSDLCENGSINLKFVHFKESDKRICYLVNSVYIRSCALILGYLIETSFNDDLFVDICSFPASYSDQPNSLNYTIAYDVKISQSSDNNKFDQKWTPSKRELRCMSVQAYKIRDSCLKFEPLRVHIDVARNIFKFNEMKLKQLSSIIQKSNDQKINLYRIGEYVDICRGPCIANTNLIGRFELSSMYTIETSSYGCLKRVQALSIPSQLHLHYWTFDWLLSKAARPTNMPLPSLI